VPTYDKTGQSKVESRLSTREDRPVHTLTDPGLRFHGDRELDAGLVDLAVNVRPQPHPPWLAGPIAAALADLARYPDDRAARAAVARRHARPDAEVLLTAGAAQAFTLLAQALRPARALVVHPQFTEPEAALRAAGTEVDRLILKADGFRLDPAEVPPDSDAVLLGNPTNPTSVLHPADVVAGLARPGRLLVVDEAFADTVPGEPASLAARRDLPGLVVVRSFTKTWGLAGLRVGYVLAAADLIERLASVAPQWPVSTPALAAAEACASPVAVATERELAVALTSHRAHLVAGLNELGLTVAGTPASSFVLVRAPVGVRQRLRERGFAVRRGETFPGLGPDWLRIAVRDTATTDAFLPALRDALETT
jgi:histidinol-phosphate aminotransferase